MTLPVLVINRAQDTDRLASFGASARAQGLDFERISAVDGHAPGFPDPEQAALFGPHFWGEDVAKPGALGCFLSHRHAWQRIVEAGHPRTLVCEDDTVFHGGADLLPADDRPGLLFLNERLSSWARTSDPSSATVALPDALHRLAALGGPKAQGLKAAPGADCYLLDRATAARLLDITAKQQIVCGVDWAMVWNSLLAISGLVAAAFPELETLRNHLPLLDNPIPARIATASLADQSGKGGSTIRHRITAPIAELKGP